MSAELDQDVIDRINDIDSGEEIVYEDGGWEERLALVFTLTVSTSDGRVLLPGQCLQMANGADWRMLENFKITTISALCHGDAIQAKNEEGKPAPISIHELDGLFQEMEVAASDPELGHVEEYASIAQEHMQSRCVGRVGVFELRPPTTPRGFVPCPDRHYSWDRERQFKYGEMSPFHYYAATRGQPEAEEAPLLKAFVEDKAAGDYQAMDITDGEVKTLSEFPEFPILLDECGIADMTVASCFQFGSKLNTLLRKRNIGKIYLGHTLTENPESNLNMCLSSFRTSKFNKRYKIPYNSKGPYMNLSEHSVLFSYTRGVGGDIDLSQHLLYPQDNHMAALADLPQ